MNKDETFDLLLKQQPVGKRIRMVLMPDDPNPIQPGSMGNCIGIDGANQLLMAWDDGRSLSLIPGTDQYEVLGEATGIV